MANDNNGNGRSWQQWMLNTVLGLCIAVGGVLYQNDATRHLQEAAQRVTWEQAQQQKQAEQDAKIAVLESKIDTQTKLMEQMNAKMDRLLVR